MALILDHPEVATRDCGDCRKYVHDQLGRIVLNAHDGKPRLRILQNPVACDLPREKGGGCPKGHYNNPNELTEQNWQAWEHYKRCRAVNRWPDDGIVAENAAAIRAATDAIESRETAKARRVNECLLASLSGNSTA